MRKKNADEKIKGMKECGGKDGRLGWAGTVGVGEQCGQMGESLTVTRVAAQ